MKIRIKINGVDIPYVPGQDIVRGFESNLLNREPEVVDFTYTFKIALTDEAVLALGYIHVLEIATLPLSYTGELIIDEVLVRAVTIYVLRIDTEKMTADINIVGDYGSYGKIVGEKKLSDLLLGGARVIGSVNPTGEAISIPDGLVSRQVLYKGCDTDVYMNKLADNIIVDDFLFPMCIDEAPTELSPSGNVGKSVINGYHADAVGGNNYYFDPMEASIALNFRGPLQPGAGKIDGDDRFYWVPMFRLTFVLRKCFEEFGFTIDPASIIFDASFQNVLLYNTFAINKVTVKEAAIGGIYYECTITHDATTVYPQNHVPDMTIVEFIHEVGKKYNLQFNIDFTKSTVAIDALRMFPFTSVIEDITTSCSKFSVINNTQNEAKWRNGYTLMYEYDGADMTSLNKEKMDEINTVGWTYTFVSKFAMESYGSPAVGQRAYLRSENAVYVYTDGGWTFLCDNIGAYYSTNNANRQEIKTKVTPITMRQHDLLYLPANMPFFADSDMIYIIGGILAPTTQYGICGDSLLAIMDWLEIKNAGGPIEGSLGGFSVVYIPKVPIQPRVMNWLYRAPMKKGNFSNDYPFASSFNVDVNGNNAGLGSTLHQFWYIWNEMNGVYWGWWYQWDKMLRSGVPVDIDMLITDVVQYQRLPWNSIRLRRNGLNYILIKSTENMPFPSVAKLEAYLLK